MKYRHTFHVDAPLENVRKFHAGSSSMAAITPPPIIVQVHRAPQELHEGDEMDFTLWLGPIPIRWLARIEQVSSSGFLDRQIKGPFKRWEHTHKFIPKADETTLVIDQVAFEVSSNPILFLIGAGMAAGLPVLFAYRAWKTRALLHSTRHRSDAAF